LLLKNRLTWNIIRPEIINTAKHKVHLNNTRKFTSHLPQKCNLCTTKFDLFMVGRETTVVCFENLTKHTKPVQWPSRLGRRSAGARLLRLWVRIPRGVRMSVYCECYILSGRAICDELITRSEESYRLWCVVVFDLATSWMRTPWPTGGCRAKNQQTNETYKCTVVTKCKAFLTLNQALLYSQSFLFLSTTLKRQETRISSLLIL